jgi:nitrogen fixation/metabolism regulation signal transduction histidine kinase
MALARRLKRALYAVLSLFGVLLWLSALMVFSQVAQNSEEFSRLQNWILVINSIGIGLLLLLISANLISLIRDYRRHVPGSRLKARMVALLVALAVAPLLAVYVFSVEFINRGIESWFDVDVEEGLSNALELSQTALDLQRLEHLEQLETVAARLASSESSETIVLLNELVRSSRASEATLFGINNRIIATSSLEPTAVVPGYPNEEVVFQLRRGQPYVSLEPRQDGTFQIVAAMSLSSVAFGAEPAILQAIYPVEERISTLANRVQESYEQYGELSFMRTALQYSFTLTLSLVLLIALLASVYGAFFSARRLVVPIQQLMAGTRAVARGDFDTLLPIPARDEIGFLINSFNEMTQRLAVARREASASQQQVESERRKLAVVLARLSTGVVALEADLRLRTANQAASAILGVDLEAHIGESLVTLAERQPELAQFLAIIDLHLGEQESEWREQVVLRGDVGRRVLMCACTALPSEGGAAPGYVVVFDDVTTLLQAQRDAAWGEVARRLAHEIKNPLTPIQLSAERLRRRYLEAGEQDAGLLDRATHTIIQQVEAMKGMVNAFSQYAHSPSFDVARFDLNALISEIAEMYRHQERPLTLDVRLAQYLPAIEADAGRIRQVLHNLMRNALEATEQQADARIEIRTRLHDHTGREAVEIAVADNGPGFLDDIVERAFDPYVTSKPKGTGLGLAIVKKLVEEHGGQIRVRNRDQGGAEVLISLPVASDIGDSQPYTARRAGGNQRE